MKSFGKNLTIIQSFPHTHLAGVSVNTKLVRNGMDIGYVSNNPFYNFNYQYQIKNDPFITITPDDALITTCTYNTMDRDDFTFVRK